MKDKNILFLVGVVVLLGVFFVYWHDQDAKKSESGVKKNVAEKVISKTELKTNTATEVNKNSNVVEDANSSGTKEAIASDIVYYYGEECPHCKNVIAYLDQNDIYSKVNFVKKEVWHNADNGKELTAVATKCGLDPNNIGVPFLYGNGKCYMGDPDVIDFFAKAAGLKK
jgi:glutaredoxin